MQYPVGDAEILTEVMNVRGVVVNACEAEEDRSGQHLGGQNVGLASLGKSIIALPDQPPVDEAQGQDHNETNETPSDRGERRHGDPRFRAIGTIGRLSAMMTALVFLRKRTAMPAEIPGPSLAWAWATVVLQVAVIPVGPMLSWMCYCRVRRRSR
jgi:hypothetical protein